MKSIAYKKILLTHDGSKLSSAAIPHALCIALSCGGEVILLHVIESVAQEVADLVPSDMVATDSRVVEMAREIVTWDRKKAAKQLNKIRSELEVAGLKSVKVKVVEGLADSVIVEVAKKEFCDLIVMSTHGRSGLGRVLIGSVADHVVRHAPCPVLLVHPS